MSFLTKNHAFSNLAEIETADIEADLGKIHCKLDDRAKDYIRRVCDFLEPLHRAADASGYKKGPPTSRTVTRAIALERELRRRDPYVPPEVIAAQYWSLYQRSLNKGEDDVARKILADLAAFQGMMPDQRLNVIVETPQIKDIAPDRLALMYRAAEALNVDTETVNNEH